MKRFNVFLAIFFLTVSVQLFAQQASKEANIYGHILDADGEHIPFATVSIAGTTLGSTTDAGGHFRLMDLPDGMLVVKAQSLGYKPEQVEVILLPMESKEVNFTLQTDVLGLEEVVITSDRNETNRANSSTIVNTLTAKMFATTESLTLSDGLNFCPGLRMENNCQNCGFSQVRMNGMEGPYSQVLINSRPIFSGLAGVYGLELIPSNMIERIEVVRGGGSALYGSNAIAGTINLILKDPISNAYEFGINAGLIGAGVGKSGSLAGDLNIKFNSSLVSDDHKSGMAIYGFYRNRDPYDANDDGFSEISSMKNTTVGSRMYHRFGTRSKIALDFFNIKEERRGGDRHEYPMHESNITEAVDHNITTAALSFEQFFRESDRLSMYVSAQKVDRDSYYGAEQSLSDYGKTKDLSYVTGAQYTINQKKSSLITGIENQGAWLKDEKMGYPDLDNAVIDFSDSSIVVPHVPNTLVADQMINTTGAFVQYEINLKRLKLSAGARFDHYIVKDNESNSDKTGEVFSPRLTMKYDLKTYLQARLSYSQGYRAPQIFDEDLHIETSGSRQVIHRNAPDLKQETSHSYMTSLDFNRQMGATYVGLLMEGFYTRLTNPFANEYSVPDEDGTVVYTRINADKGAHVAGINLELNVVPSSKINLKGGFTVQQSKYEEPQEFDERRFFRTPNDYGYFTFDWQTTAKLGIAATGNYTGKMLVPYFGMQIPNPEEGELRETERFVDLGLKLRYDIKLSSTNLQVYAGIKNIFNSYQDDFDRGIDRDPGYIYGPMLPRTIYFGLKFGNML